MRLHCAVAVSTLALLGGCVLSDASRQVVEENAGVRASQVPTYLLVADVEIAGPRTGGPQEVRVEFEGDARTWASARLSVGTVVLGQVLVTRPDSVLLWLRPPGGRATLYRGTAADLSRALCAGENERSRWLCMTASLPAVVLEPTLSRDARTRQIRVRAAVGQPEMEITLVRDEGVVRQMEVRTRGGRCTPHLSVTFSRRVLVEAGVRIPVGSAGVLRASAGGPVLGVTDARVRRFEITRHRARPALPSALAGAWPRLARDPVVEEVLRRTRVTGPACA